MDVKKAVSIVNDAFDKWMIDKNLDTFNQYNVIQALNVCLDDCIKSGDSYNDAFYKDAQTEYEINEQLHYISDRWFASGRIRFILRVIDNV